MINEIFKYFEKKNIENNIKCTWNELMDSYIKKEDEKREFEIGEINIKQYGFDACIYPKIGKNINDFRKLIPTISNHFKAEIIAEYSNTKKCIYFRCHLHELQINDVDNIKFKWYSTFSESKYRNTNGETYKIDKITPIKNPNLRKDNENCTVGYKLNIKIPFGLDYANLIEKQESLSFQLGKCFIKRDRVNNNITCEVIIKPLSDNEKFVPVSLKSPYQLYLAMTHSYKPVVADLSKKPHLLYTGQSQTGKTVAVITALTNLCYQYNEDKIRIFCSMISAKQDLRIFKNVRQCDYYADDLKTSLKLLKYLHNEMKRRNKLFESSNKFCASMYQWNKMYPNKRLPIIIASFDEMTLYMPTKSDSKPIKAQKQACVDLMHSLIIESASAGINILFCLQRPDKDSFNPSIKAQVGNKIGFFQPNSASSLVAMDDDSCTHLAPKREAVVDYAAGREFVKTLFLTNEMVEDILKDKIIPNKKHLNLNNNGIIENDEVAIENDVKTIKNDKETDKNEEKPKKISRWEKNTNRRKLKND